jgi:hypothetical protein
MFSWAPFMKKQSRILRLAADSLPHLSVPPADFLKEPAATADIVDISGKDS